MPASPSSHSLHAHGGPDGSPALVSGASSSDLQLKVSTGEVLFVYIFLTHFFPPIFNS